MKTQGRTLTIALILAVVSCGLILALRAFAQSATTATTEYTLNFTNARLKQNYGDDASNVSGDFKTKILDKYGKAYDVVGKDNHGNNIGHHKAKGGGKSGAKGTARLNESSEIIRVVNMTPATSPTGAPDIITGPHVTQNISTSSASDMAQVLDAFQ